MKKISVITLVIALFATSQLSAQLSIGPRIGIGFADQSLDIAGFGVNPKTKIGFDLGVVLNAELGNGMALQPEIHYSQRGFEVDVLGLLSSDVNVNYLRIPLLFKYDVLNQNESLSLTPFAGPFLGIKLKESADLFDPIIDNSDVYSDTDIGLDFGLMLSLESGLFFDARYSLGLTDIIDIPLVDVAEAHNRAFSIGVGYRFNLR